MHPRALRRLDLLRNLVRPLPFPAPLPPQRQQRPRKRTRLRRLELRDRHRPYLAGPVPAGPANPRSRIHLISSSGHTLSPGSFCANPAPCPPC